MNPYSLPFLRNRGMSLLASWFLLVFGSFSPSLHAQSSDTKLEVLEERIARYQEKTQEAHDMAQESHDSAIVALNKSELAKELSDSRYTQVLTFLYIISGITGIILAVAAFFEFTRRKEDQNRFQRMIDRQERLDQIQIAYGEQNQQQSVQIVGEQIEGLAKLSEVIGLVEQTFKLKIEESEEKKKEMEELRERNEALENEINLFGAHFLGLFESVRKNLEGFAKMSRMAWANISEEEQRLLASSRNKFSNIPIAILKRIKKKNHVIEVYYRLGMGAFCSNQITDAMVLFEGGKQFYEEWEPKKDSEEELDKKAVELVYTFCIHYLGLIEKNWLPDGYEVAQNMLIAKNHLEEANRLMEHRGHEFMTPITLFEVLTYLPNYRKTAQDMLSAIWNKFERVKKEAGELAPNQQKLYSRCLLLQGNLEFQMGDKEKALDSYGQAIEHTPNNYYAIFSKAMIFKELGHENMADLFLEGLAKMESTQALKKPEISTRGTLLAWAVIATCHADSEQKDLYMKQLMDLKHNLRKWGNRSALFFSPLTKKPVTIETLLENVERECGLS